MTDGYGLQATEGKQDAERQLVEVRQQAAETSRSAEQDAVGNTALVRATSAQQAKQEAEKAAVR